jgi:DUF1680 family protein
MLGIKPVQLKNVKINDKFWSKCIELVHNVIIPYQLDIINDKVKDAEPSHAVRNFRIAAGLEKGEFYGFVFQDTDVAKWLEAVSYRLETHPNNELEKTADEIIDLIGKAQQDDGYLNTYFIVKEPDKRWTNLHECHELYTAGHMIEAAVAYYNATGKKKLLDIMCKFVDYIDTVFGPEPEKLKGYGGHQEIELALVKLYRATENEKYLNLSKYFIDERGSKPYYFEKEWEKREKVSHFMGPNSENPIKHAKYNQAHLPVKEQDKAVGHAVRAVYMYTAMADLAKLSDDKELLKACKTLWTNMITKQMYITGGIGSTSIGEAFTFDYDLPNDIVYQETCASIGLMFFAQRMLQIESDSQYADVMERALYNSVLSGKSLDGKSFFYVNPLEVWPEASEKNPTREHVKPVRQKWYPCACCPPNVSRLLASLGQYIYTQSENTIYTHLYIGNETNVELKNTSVNINQTTNYPWDGKILIDVNPESETEFTLALRIPDWCANYMTSINGRSTKAKVEKGYLLINRKWSKNDKINLDLGMPATIIEANPKVRANVGKLAIQRGPLVYCIEEADNGKNLNTISIPSDSKFAISYDENFLGGMTVIKLKGFKKDTSKLKEDKLYTTKILKEKEVELKLVPYFAWGNREPGEMQVWIRAK